MDASIDNAHGKCFNTDLTFRKFDITCIAYVDDGLVPTVSTATGTNFMINAEITTLVTSFTTTNDILFIQVELLPPLLRKQLRLQQTKLLRLLQNALLRLIQAQLL